jgi:hypothetical protein
MATYIDEKRRRIERFVQYLRLMGIRRHKAMKDDCFVIFDAFHTGHRFEQGRPLA